MTIPNRTVSLTGVFAKEASTTIPSSPVSGVSYRDTSLTKETVEEGWPYKEVVDSGSFNQMLYEYAYLTDQVEKYGFIPWSALTDYVAGSLCLGSDGKIYQAKQATGPSSTAYDPVNDTSNTYWEDFVGSSYVTLSTSQTITGPKIFTNITKFKANAQEVLDAVLGTPPSETKYAVFGVEDKNGTWLGGFEQIYDPNGYIFKQMVQLKPDGSNNAALFQIGFDSNQNEYVGASSGVMQGINRWGMPNYNAGYTFPYGGVTPYNGVIKVRHLEYVNAQLYVGSNLVYNHTWSGGDFGAQYQETFIPVSNGETITWANMESVIFIPCNGG